MPSMGNNVMRKVQSDTNALGASASKNSNRDADADDIVDIRQKTPVKQFNSKSS